jgi:alpha-beta hydrolase superfamily lysophospholipase
MKTEQVSFVSEGQKIAGVLHLPDKKRPSCVIASHGHLSSKESEKFIALGERLSQEEIAMLRFDFRGCGESEGRIEDDTITRRIADLAASVQFMRSYPGLGKKRGLVGSSLGGYLSLLKASMDKEIRATVIWATPFHLDDLGSKKAEEESPSPGEAFLQDLPRHRLLPLLTNVSNCLVIHGNHDEVVPMDQAWEIFNGLGSPKEIRVIEGGDHRLTDPVHRQRAIDLSVAWFKKFL